MANSILKNLFGGFSNSNKYDEHYEKRFMTILSDLGFGKNTMKKGVNEGFLLNTYVYAIINRIAETGADIPVIIENKRGEEIEIITEGDFYNFVHQPNPETNYKSFTYQSLVYQLTTGNEFHYGVQGVGNNAFSERWNLAPQYINPKVNWAITGAYASSYKYNIGGKEYNLTTEEVMHLKKFNPDPNSENPTMGLSPLQAAFRTLIASNEIITADASLIKNKGAFGLLSNKGERPLRPEEREQMDRSLKERIGGGHNYGSIKATSGNFDFVKLAMSSQDLQILESGVMKLRDLCSIYGANSRMFNDPNAATYNNAKQDIKNFYLNAVIPPLENDLDHFNKFFVEGWNIRDNANYTVKLDLSGIDVLQEEQAIKLDKAQTCSNIITQILAGVGTEWSSESAVNQLMEVLGYTEEQARMLVDETPENNI
jgi:HK97 family phage portal protein